ncbi:DNA repair and recombination protein RAD26 [Aaosphaeria arxii CBS 175.79]|uniref:DNA repair and recombination protein RAD26 n=1 Tax=Aaosphaeria arxii CBS 175.79 TaxID=1450172 RepID=A0A6A5XT62_9PLEO|nr:DNA repair and recombination protein RAD26 [Aaosphaeria arxii CBS 175.79]KAF2016133.1 DNA repair and recombination protein RAD26 [Aaosphaeria arxii CBS 175.79]
MHTSESDTAQAPEDTSSVLEKSGTSPNIQEEGTAVNEDASDMESVISENADEEARLKYLTTGTRNQDDMERDIGRQADQLLTEQADERDKKRMEKNETEVKRTQVAIQKLRNRLAMPMVDTQKLKLRAELAGFQKRIDEIDAEQDIIQKRINDRHKGPEEEESLADGVNRPLPNESRRDFLIRTGKITPFSKLAQAQGTESKLEEVMLDAEVEDIIEEPDEGPKSHQNLMKPGFQDVESDSSASNIRPAKKRRITRKVDFDDSSSAAEGPGGDSDDDFESGMTDRQLAALSESEGAYEELSEDDDYKGDSGSRKSKTSVNKNKKEKVSQPVAEEEDLAGVDDGNERVYKDRLRKWTHDRSNARKRANEKQGIAIAEEEDEECYLPHPTQSDTEFDGGFRIPGDIYPALFDYQKTGVQWLWELYAQGVGGIVGDEMGLGKTIQAISFIAGLHYSRKLVKPVIVVCPATVMKQWVNEFHRWWPALRVSILHTSGSGMLDTRREDRMEREMELRSYGDYDETLTSAGKAAKKIVEKVKRHGHVLVTTYSGLQTYAEFLIPTEWDVAVLDEGHKIRNPNTSITIHCKELRTPNRIILSGTPMQNNLTELWSLFDFVYPMRLGTLINFRNQFEFPIKRGGYANASNLEYETAMRCAETLKDAISPYLLQRFKVDVATDLPKKKEQVLFCKLTKQQRSAYENFLSSDEMKSIQSGKRQMLYGIDWLRKVCNHPDLTDHKNGSKRLDYGAANKSGKMQVVKELVSLWKKGGHKTLLFAQHRIMLDILEKMMKSLDGINYRRMDGETPIKNRQDLVDEFNRNPDLHVFLLTTKVGGLGVNLTGANRVIIYDPDWNPSTDVQARERSWRLGQKREVEIYRLMSAGTIEEKIYHRQIFKQFLTNRVLRDPKKQQTFQMSDLHDLFTLGNESVETETETANIFRGSEVDFEAGKESGKALPTPTSDTGKGKAKETDSETTTKADLAKVYGIDHAETFQAPTEEEEPATESKAEGENGEGKSDNRLMSTIFAKSGVHSVLEHDAIMSSAPGGRKRKVQADPAFIQREARRTAAQAAEELRKAEQQARTVPAGTLTWTGLYGEAGRPEAPRPRPMASSTRGGLGASRGGRGGGPSSSSILTNLAARQGRGDTSGGSSSRSGTSTPTAFRGRAMLERIREFMLTHNGSVPTKMLVDQFDHLCRQVPGRSEEFRECLKTLATLEKGTAGRGRWVLKEEWRRNRPSGRA